MKDILERRQRKETGKRSQLTKMYGDNYNVGHWNIDPVGKSKEPCKTHTPELSHLRAKGTGAFIPQLLLDTDQSCSWETLIIQHPQSSMWTGKEDSRGQRDLWNTVMGMVVVSLG